MDSIWHSWRRLIRRIAREVSIYLDFVRRHCESGRAGRAAAHAFLS
jgi:hypothetical protein